MITCQQFHTAVANYQTTGQNHIRNIQTFYRNFRRSYFKEGVWLAVAAIVPSQGTTISKKARSHSWVRQDVLQVIQPLLTSIGNTATEKESHQYRLPITLLQQQADIISNQSQVILGLRTFDDIHDYINQHRLSGFGPLAVYDSALRIGFILNKLPNKIYLHAGVAEGASLLGVTIQRRKYIAVQDINNLFFSLPLQPFEVENFLCSQRDAFTWNLLLFPVNRTIISSHKAYAYRRLIQKLWS